MPPSDEPVAYEYRRDRIRVKLHRVKLCGGE